MASPSTPAKAPSVAQQLPSTPSTPALINTSDSQIALESMQRVMEQILKQNQVIIEKVNRLDKRQEVLAKQVDYLVESRKAQDELVNGGMKLLGRLLPNLKLDNPAQIIDQMQFQAQGARMVFQKIDEEEKQGKELLNKGEYRQALKHLESVKELSSDAMKSSSTNLFGSLRQPVVPHHLIDLVACQLKLLATDETYFTDESIKKVISDHELAIAKIGKSRYIASLDSGFSTRMLGLCYFYQNLDKQALLLFNESAQNSHGDRPYTLFAKGRCEERMGKTEAAIATYETGLSECEYRDFFKLPDDFELLFQKRSDSSEENKEIVQNALRKAIERCKTPALTSGKNEEAEGGTTSL